MLVHLIVAHCPVERGEQLVFLVKFFEILAERVVLLLEIY